MRFPFSKKKFLWGGVLALVLLVFLIYRPHSNNWIWYLKDFKYALKENFGIIPNFISSFEVEEDKLWVEISEPDWEAVVQDYHLVNEGSPETRKHKTSYKKSILNDGHPSLYHLCQLRLKGQMSDHWEDLDRLSFKIKLGEGDSIYDMRKFSLQHPRTRYYMEEVIFHKLVDFVGLNPIQFKFVRYYLNKKNKGIYNLEELPGASYLRRNGIPPTLVFLILKGSEISLDPLFGGEDSLLLANTTSNLKDFFAGRKQPGEVFELESIAKLFAITDLVGYHHCLGLGNMWFYINPKTGLIEPIPHDNTYVWNLKEIIINYETDPSLPQVQLESWVPEMMKEGFIGPFLEDSLFAKYYLSEVHRLSDPQFLEDFFTTYKEELEIDQKTLYKSYPSRRFRKRPIMDENQVLIRDRLKKRTPLNQ